LIDFRPSGRRNPSQNHNTQEDSPLNRRLQTLTIAIAIAASGHAFAESAASSTCGPLDEAVKLVLEGFHGEPFQELTEAQVHVARGVLLNPGNGQDARALAATRVIVSKTDLGEATIFVDGDRACSLGFLPPGAIGLIDALKNKPMVEVGTGS
jgi:hypothetical protein